MTRRQSPSRIARPATVAGMLLLAATGCRIDNGLSRLPSVRTTLYFGLSVPGGDEVSAGQFEAFVDREVATRFPAGFTILRADGAWREGERTRREPSRVLVIVHGFGADDAKIDAVREAYCRAFRQEAVLRVDERDVVVSFRPASRPSATAGKAYN